MKNAENLEDIYGLTPLQEGMLFHSLYEPHSNLYFEQISFALHGEINLDAFEQAWVQVVERNPIMRTCFYWEDLDKPLQVVHRQVELPFYIQDWDNFSATEQRQKLEDFLAEDRAKGFDLSDAPLIRLTLIRLGKDVHQFLFSFHHIILDGWSLPLVFQEFSTIYEAYRQRKSVQLKQNRPFGDFVAWLQQQDLSKAEIFWRKMLSGYKGPSPLWVDRDQGAQTVQNEGYAEQKDEVSKATTIGLQDLARQHHITVYTLVQGAWALLLSRYSGEDDIVFGTIVSGRPTNLESVESMIGMFINNLPVRVRVPSESRLIPWLKELQAQQIEARQYEYSPLVHIHGWSEVPRNIPLFESIFAFENYPLNGSSLREEESNSIIETFIFEKTNYPITVIVGPGPELWIKILYMQPRFTQATIQRMIRHFRTLLEGMVANPECLLSDLPLLDPAEYHQLLVEWNQTQSAYPRQGTIAEVFESQVARGPERLSVVFENEHLSYGELNRRANRVAHYLQGLGVGPDVLVGICMERSIEMIVGLLGILKAGGAYVPLDPSYPQERLAYMIGDTDLQVILSQERLRAVVPVGRPPVVCLDHDWEGHSMLSDENPSSGVTADHLAYLIYTSGSTGNPKGVAVTHRNVLRLVKETDYITISERDIFLQFAPLAFDASTFEIWGCLLNGAQLVIFPAELPSLEELGQVIQNSQVTVLWLTAGLFHQMVEHQLSHLRNVRQLLAGGDVLSTTHVQRALQGLPECRLINGYGPTENTTFSCCYSIRGLQEFVASVPIGRPIANTQAYVLDGRLQPVPIGVPGELYLGGDGLGRGYWNHPDLTAERFIPHPFSQQPGMRLYKTGDLVRYLPDGHLEFLGRLDRQVKIRGFRVELGEVEASLGKHPNVQAAVVLARENTAGDRRLIAYLVASKASAVSTNELRHFLQRKLPEYLIPSSFIFLDTMPLTANGKVDRRALPKLDKNALEVRETYEEPRNNTEHILMEIWVEVLHVPQVGRHQHFFTDLGGHSLQATQIISRVRAAFQIELPLRAIFEASTVASLAAMIDSVKMSGSQVEQHSIPRVSRQQHSAKISDD